jgi:agmatine deiminase
LALIAEKMATQENKSPRTTSARAQTPARLGFRMPAEWEPHEATWIGWPHNRTDWPGKIAPIHWAYAEIVKKIASGEIVRIIVNSANHAARAQRTLERSGVDLSRTEFFFLPTNRGWTRDFGPIFVKRTGRASNLAIVCFRFNAWAKYADWEKDDQVAERVAGMLGLRLFQADAGGHPIVLEGGAVDVNGAGTVITTEECLLDQKIQPRNPSLGRAEIESVLQQYLGATNVLWLGRGIAGDDTHGHVDDICRFVNQGTVVLCREGNRSDPNYTTLEENHERMEGMRLEDDSRLEVVELPMPSPLYFDGRRLPASYANFYICNAAVLVPTFNDAKDRLALGILSELIKDRPVVGIHAVDLVWGFGTLHCLTQQQPSV